MCVNAHPSDSLLDVTLKASALSLAVPAQFEAPLLRQPQLESPAGPHPQDLLCAVGWEAVEELPLLRRDDAEELE
jgi:hypothetical protein